LPILTEHSRLYPEDYSALFRHFMPFSPILTEHSRLYPEDYSALFRHFFFFCLF